MQPTKDDLLQNRPYLAHLQLVNILIFWVQDSDKNFENHEQSSNGLNIYPMGNRQEIMTPGS